MTADTNSPTVSPVMGRPTDYSEELAARILDRLASGDTLVAICLDPDMPSTTTVYNWRNKKPDFMERFTRARHDQMHTWADECVGIADDGTTDYITKTGRNGVEYEAVDQEHIQRSRLRVDTRLRIMAVVAPHAYGQNVAHEVSVQIDVTHTISDRERMRRMALFLLEDQAADDGAVIEGEASPID